MFSDPPLSVNRATAEKGSAVTGPCDRSGVAQHDLTSAPFITSAESPLPCELHIHGFWDLDMDIFGGPFCSLIGVPKYFLENGSQCPDTGRW